jgi:hypothetical protein
MKIKKALSILFLCMMLSSAASAATDPLARLEGTWYVNMTNFKMWLKGNKLNPQFIYALQTKGGVAGLNDIVRYDQRGKEKLIKGFDKPANEHATKFIWRGNGLLALFKSTWEILYQNDQWAIIHFGKTAATAEGYDVISRQKRLDDAMLAAIRLKLKELGITQELTLLKQR